jgi:ribulose-5-phosphate 4-epimerase/fuculose-1-phosphate aldolase
MTMTPDEAIDRLVEANHILAHERVVDAFGHISMRHPRRPKHFLLSCSRSPELVSAADILEFGPDGEPVDGSNRPLYKERFIHSSIYGRRADVGSVMHNHSYAVIPFSVSKVKLRPVIASTAKIGKTIPVWDIRKKFGATNMLVTNSAKGDDLAKCLGKNTSVLMRGHGCTVVGRTVFDATLSSIYLQVNAQLQMDAMRLGRVAFLHDDEIDLIWNKDQDRGASRSWEYLKTRARKA